MNKTLFHYAMALCMGFCLLACSEDEESTPDYGVNLPAAKYADKAVSLTISNPSAISVTPAAAGPASVPTLQGVNITESGTAIFETLVDGSKKYASTEVTIDGDTYTLANGKGTITVYRGRATASVSIVMNITIDIPGVGSVAFSTQPGYPAAATEETATASGGQTLDYMARTWNLEAITLDLKGDVEAFRIFKSGDLAAIRDYAIEQGANIAQDEREAFERVVETITISKTGLMAINYADGRIDAATWNWTTEQYNEISLNFMDNNMGNKFLNNDSQIEVVFSEDMCLLKIHTKITGSKNYDVTASFRLRAQK